MGGFSLGELFVLESGLPTVGGLCHVVGGGGGHTFLFRRAGLCVYFLDLKSPPASEVLVCQPELVTISRLVIWIAK